MVSGAVKEPCQRALRLHLAEARLELKHAAASGTPAALRTCRAARSHCAGDMHTSSGCACECLLVCAGGAGALKCEGRLRRLCSQASLGDTSDKGGSHSKVRWCSMRGALHVTPHASRLDILASKLLRNGDCEYFAHTQTSARTL